MNEPLPRRKREGLGVSARCASLRLREDDLRALTLAALLAAPAFAADFALNAGALEVVAFPPPAHAGLYPNLGVSVALPGPDVTWIVALSFEWSFDQGRGGLVLVGTADFPLSERVGLDLNLALIHDQPGVKFDHADFYVGGGPGLSFFFGKWTVSPYLSIFAGLVTPGASFVPGVNLARTL